ncbi:hypothetical protein SAMN05444166_8467 [Singulisphaera sp. GP187]|nr:hypothetical protein SAMN05444166_8467 [Singulisphaera sp. GP187]
MGTSVAIDQETGISLVLLAFRTYYVAAQRAGIES